MQSRGEVLRMVSEAGPRCLNCGDFMRVTNSTVADIGLTAFERRHLICSNCGDLDSQFALVSPATASSFISENESSVISQEQHRELDSFHNGVSAATGDDRGAQPVRGFADFLKEVVGVEAVTVSHQSQTRPPDAPLQSRNSEEGISETDHTFAEVLQNYMAKWRHVHKTS
jgi:hypothetical protein